MAHLEETKRLPSPTSLLTRVSKCGALRWVTTQISCKIPQKQHVVGDHQQEVGVYSVFWGIRVKKSLDTYNPIRITKQESQLITRNLP